MKKILVSTFLLIILFIYFVPKYNELNNIMIIDKVKVIKDNNTYNITFREVIPKRNNNGIIYTYKYQAKFNNINKAIKKKKKNTNKKLYLSKVKSLITNINSDLIINTYHIKPKNIIIH